MDGKEKFRIRKFKPADAKAVAAVIARAQRITLGKLYPKKLINFYIEYNSPEKVLEHARKSTVFVACRNDTTVVGVVSLKDNFIKRFFVDPALQGQGVGRKLFERCRDYAVRKGYKTLEVNSTKYAVPVYKALGFVKIGKIRKEHVGEVFYDVLLSMNLKSILKSEYKILSVGGSIIIPKTGFDIPFLKAFRSLILKRVKKGEKFILVIGGGATCRQYQDAARQVVKMTDEELDWLGIKTTVFNAEFVRVLFKGYAHPEIITNPTKKIATKYPILVGAGWKPGCSTDKDAVLLAKTYGATELVNLSNIDYVYDSDPRVNPNAKKIERITWKEFRKIVGNKWSPGANLPFDPIASRDAEKLKLTVKFTKGTDLGQVKKVLTGGMFNGTVIGSK